MLDAAPVPHCWSCEVESPCIRMAAVALAPPRPQPPAAVGMCLNLREEFMLAFLHAKFGPDWRQISKHLGGLCASALCTYFAAASNANVSAEPEPGILACYGDYIQYGSPPAEALELALHMWAGRVRNKSGVVLVLGSLPSEEADIVGKAAEFVFGPRLQSMDEQAQQQAGVQLAQLQQPAQKHAEQLQAPQPVPEDSPTSDASAGVLHTQVASAPAAETAPNADKQAANSAPAQPQGKQFPLGLLRMASMVKKIRKPPEKRNKPPEPTEVHVGTVLPVSHKPYVPVKAVTKALMAVEVECRAARGPSRRTSQPGTSPMLPSLQRHQPLHLEDVPQAAAPSPEHPVHTPVEGIDPAAPGRFLSAGGLSPGGDDVSASLVGLNLPGGQATQDHRSAGVSPAKPLPPTHMAAPAGRARIAPMPAHRPLAPVRAINLPALTGVVSVTAAAMGGAGSARQPSSGTAATADVNGAVRNAAANERGAVALAPATAPPAITTTQPARPAGTAQAAAAPAVVNAPNASTAAAVVHPPTQSQAPSISAPTPPVNHIQYLPNQPMFLRPTPVSSKPMACLAHRQATDRKSSKTQSDLRAAVAAMAAAAPRLDCSPSPAHRSPRGHHASLSDGLSALDQLASVAAAAAAEEAGFQMGPLNAPGRSPEPWLHMAPPAKRQRRGSLVGEEDSGHAEGSHYEKTSGGSQVGSRGGGGGGLGGGATERSCSVQSTQMDVLTMVHADQGEHAGSPRGGQNGVEQGLEVVQVGAQGKTSGAVNDQGQHGTSLAEGTDNGNQQLEQQFSIQGQQEWTQHCVGSIHPNVVVLSPMPAMPLCSGAPSTDTTHTRVQLTSAQGSLPPGTMVLQQPPMSAQHLPPWSVMHMAPQPMQLCRKGSDGVQNTMFVMAPQPVTYIQGTMAPSDSNMESAQLMQIPATTTTTTTSNGTNPTPTATVVAMSQPQSTFMFPYGQSVCMVPQGISFMRPASMPSMQWASPAVSMQQLTSMSTGTMAHTTSGMSMSMSMGMGEGEGLMQPHNAGKRFVHMLHMAPPPKQ